MPTCRPPSVLAVPVVLLWLASCARGEGLDEAFVRRTAEEAARALALDPGLEVGPVEIVLLTRDEALARRRAFGELLGSEGAMTRASDEIGEALMGGSMLGRYVPDEKVVYVYRDTLIEFSGGDVARAASLLFPVLAHELVHAYDDQRHAAVPLPENLLGALGDPEGLAHIQTQMSLLEGRAAYLSERACRAVVRSTLPMPTVEQAQRAQVFPTDGSLVGDVAASAGNAVARMKLVQYAYGQRFAEKAYLYGGLDFVDQVFGFLPLSADELADFELFRQRWAEEVIAREEAEAEAAWLAAHGSDEDGELDAAPDAAGTTARDG